MDGEEGGTEGSRKGSIWLHPYIHWFLHLIGLSNSTIVLNWILQVLGRMYIWAQSGYMISSSQYWPHSSPEMQNWNENENQQDSNTVTPQFKYLIELIGSPLPYATCWRVENVKPTYETTIYLNQGRISTYRLSWSNDIYRSCHF